MYDWKKNTNDPMDPTAHAEMSKYLLSRLFGYECSRIELIQQFAANKKVLDIGAGEHDPKYFSENWEHQHIASAAQHYTGLDLEQHLVDHYNSKGFNFICMDATSAENTGEQYDFIFCGDVIEHTNSPVDLVLFIKRHLKPDGSAILTTPNPFSNFMRKSLVVTVTSKPLIKALSLKVINLRSKRSGFLCETFPIFAASKP